MRTLLVILNALTRDGQPWRAPSRDAFSSGRGKGLLTLTRYEGAIRDAGNPCARRRGARPQGARQDLSWPADGRRTIWNGRYFGAHGWRFRTRALRMITMARTAISLTFQDSRTPRWAPAAVEGPGKTAQQGK